MKQFSLLLLSGLTLLFASCDNGASLEWHQTYVYTNPSTTGAEIVYADQERDSLFITSTDSWTATKSSNWLTIEKTSFTVPAGYSYSVRSYIYTYLNKTDTVRTDHVVVRADGKDYIKQFKQLPWIDVKSPEIQYTDKENISTGYFEKICKAKDTKDSIIFYLRSAKAELTSDNDWVTISQPTFTNKYSDYNPLVCRTAIIFNENTSTEPREAVVTIRTLSTDKEATSTRIKIKQQGATPKKE